MHNIHTSYLWSITFIVSLGGFLFGYDWVLVGGAKPFYEAFFGISNQPNLQGWVMACAIVGCLVGVLISGALADRYGRKPLLLLAAVLFLFSAWGTGSASELNLFIAFRILGGVGIGVASNLSPIYIAEIAPASSRGALVSINQLAIVLGILGAQIMNWWIAEPVIEEENLLDSWNGQTGWRWTFWAGAVPAVLFLVLLFTVPESPKWLSHKKKSVNASNIRQRIRMELDISPESVGSTRVSLFKGRMLRLLILGGSIAVFQQWCGINIIFNYAEDVFVSAGYDLSAMLFNIVVTGVINVIFTLLGMYPVDKIGRRILMLSGAGGLMLVYAAMASCYYWEVQGHFVLLLVLIAIGRYAMTLAPLTWVVIAQIFPREVRARAMGVATAMLWIACFVLTYTFPVLNSKLGAAGTFWLYGVICLAGFLFVRSQLFETKGKSLEEIEQM